MATSKPSGPMSTDTAIALLTQKVDNLLVDAGQSREQMTEIVKAVNKLAVVEERQAADRGALERAFGSITALGERVRKLEESDPINKLSSSTVQKAIWLVMAAFIGATLKGTFTPNAPAMIQVAPGATTQPAQTTNQPHSQ